MDIWAIFSSQGHAGPAGQSHAAANRQTAVAIRSFSHFCYFPSKRSFATKFIQAKSAATKHKDTDSDGFKTDNLICDFARTVSHL